MTLQISYVASVPVGTTPKGNLTQLSVCVHAFRDRRTPVAVASIYGAEQAAHEANDEAGRAGHR